MQITELEDLYAAAVYDYAFLDRALLDSKATHRMAFGMEHPIFNEKGYRTDTIRDTFPMPDLLHVLQVTLSFLEKTCKYAIALFDKQVTMEYLRGLWHDVSKISSQLASRDPHFLESLQSTGLLEELNELAKLDYTTLRYFHKPNEKFSVNTIMLMELVKFFHSYLLRIRYTFCYTDPDVHSAIKAHNKANPRIIVHGGIVESPAKEIDSTTFDHLCSDARISETDRKLLKDSYKEGADHMRLLREPLNTEESKKLFAILHKLDHVYADFTKLTIQIK